MDGLARFASDLEAHTQHGFVFSNDKFFVMVRPVVKECRRLIADPWHEFTTLDCNAWYIWLAAGNIDMLWDYMPFHLPMIGWSRRDGPQRFYPTEKLRAKCKSNPLFIRALS